MKFIFQSALVIAAVSCASLAGAETAISIHATAAEGVGDVLGTITAVDGDYGLVLTPDLKGLAPGVHGFHVHTNPACGPAEKDGKTVPGLAAGGHYDPTGSGMHKGPYDASGHLGDLPPLYVAVDGAATIPLLAPRLKEVDLQGRSLMIHASGDNFSDDPKPLGGGGARAACGVVE